MDETEPGSSHQLPVPHPSCRTHTWTQIIIHTYIFLTTELAMFLLSNGKVRLAGCDSSVNVLGSEQFRLGIIPGTLPIQH